MLSYETQLDLKQNVVVKAYKNFSGLPGSSVPTVQSTIGSPLQYGYRTKITPHFEVRPKDIKAKDSIEPGTKPDWLRIGFNKVNTKFVMDIEVCSVLLSRLQMQFTETHSISGMPNRGASH